MARGFAAGRAALRIARRDALRAKGRTLLVAAMIGLPVMLVSAADVVARSEANGPAQIIWRELGTDPELQAKLEPWSPGWPIAQNADGTIAGQFASSPVAGTQPDPEQVAAALTAALPPGNRLLTDHNSYGERFRVADDSSDAASGGGFGEGGRSVRADLRQADWTEPTLAGLVELVDGELPNSSGEVAVSSAFARHAGVEIGDEVRYEVEVPPTSGAAEPTERVLDVVGVARLNQERNSRTVFGAPGLLAADAVTGAGSPAFSYAYQYSYVVGPNPVTWDDVLRLNELGTKVVSRAVVNDPPSDAELSPELLAANEISAEAGAVVATVVGLALLEVALLAGPAFAVGARRNLRHLALVSASGGNRQQVGSIVLAGGLVIGLGASVVGAGLGALLGVVSLPVIEHYERGDFAHTDVRLFDLSMIFLVGTLTAVAAAVVPAWQASKIDAVAALAGRRGQATIAKRVPVLGIVAFAVGVGLAVLGATGREPLLVLAGTAAATLGLITTAGSWVALFARLARRLSPAPRIALRDAARQRGRTAPAVGAVMAAVTGSVAISIYVAALDNHDRLNYRPQAAPGNVAVELSRWGQAGPLPPHQPAAVETTLREHLPLGDVRPVGVLSEPDNLAPYAYPESRPDVVCDGVIGYSPGAVVSLEAPLPEEADAGCGEAGMITAGHPVIVDDGSTADLVTGGGYPGIRALVEDDLVAVTNPRYLQSDGTVVIKVSPPPNSDRIVDGVARSEPERSLVLPARLVERTGGTPVDLVIVPPAVAAAEGYVVAVTALVANTTEQPSENQAERAQAALSDAGVDTYLVVERGYQSGYAVGLLALAVAAGAITLGATGIAVGLAAADGRADLATLAAVGASPAVRRRLAASQAAVIAGIGAVMGVVAGAVPGLAVVWMQRHGPLGLNPTWEFVVPWTSLAVVVVVVPAVAVGCGWLFTRSRLPMIRRIAL